MVRIFHREVIGIAGAIDHFLADPGVHFAQALEGEAQVPAFPAQLDVAAVLVVRRGAAQDFAVVFGIDDAVRLFDPVAIGIYVECQRIQTGGHIAFAIEVLVGLEGTGQVLVAQVARTDGGVQFGGGVYFFLGLEDAGAAVAVEGVVLVAFPDDVGAQAPVAAQVAHHRGIVGQVEGHRVGEVTFAVAPADLEFPTVGVHVADVVGRVAETDHIRDLAGHQHIKGILAVDIAREIEPAVEHGQIEADIPGLGGFPGKVFHGQVGLGGGHVGGERAGAGVHHHDVAMRHGRLPGIVADAVVTQHTIAAPDFQEVDEIGIPVLEEGFFGDHPAHRHGREEAAAVFAGKAGGLVVTGIGLQEVTAFVVVGEAAEEGTVGVLGGIAGAAQEVLVTTDQIGKGTELHLVGAAGERLREGGIILITGHVGGMVVLAEILLVVEEHLFGDLVSVTARFLQRIVGTAAERGIGQDTGLAVVVSLFDEALLFHVVDARGNDTLDGEVLERGNRDGSLAEEGVAPGVVKTAGMQAGIGVGTIVARAHRSVGPDRYINRVVQVGGTDRVDLVVVAVAAAEAQVESHADELVHADIVVQAGGVLFLVAAQVEGVGLAVGEHGAALDDLVSVGNAQAVLGLRSPFVDAERIPVRNRIGVRVEGVVGVVVVDERLLILEIVVAGGVAGIVPLGFVLEFHEAGGADHIRMARTRHHGIAAVVIHAQVAFLGPFGGDEDDTGCSTGTVDGGGGRILQHGNALDGIGIHIAHAAHRNPVNHHERGGVVDGGDTADTDGGAGARKAAGTGNFHAGHRSLDSLGDAHALHVGHFGTVHVGHGTGEVFLLYGTVTDHHDFIQDRSVFLEGEINHGTSAHGGRFRGISHEGNFEDGVGRRYGQHILAVDVGDGTVGGALLHDASPDDGLSVLIEDGSPDLELILGRSGPETCGQQEGEDE